MNGTSARSPFFRLAGLFLCLVMLCMPGLGVRAARLADIILVTTTIQAAIDAAVDGDTISIPAALYVETLTVDKSLTLAALAGAGGDMAAIWPVGNNRIITVQPGHNLVLKDLVLAGGFPSGPGTYEGGAVYIQDGTLTIDHCMIYSNHGNYGGAVRQTGTGQVIVQNGSMIYTNHALADGGGIAADGSLSLADFTLEYNQADRHGGGASVMGDQFTALRGTVTGNVASQNGGGVNVSKSVTVDQVEFVDNSAGANGGGILQWNGNDVYSVVIQNSTFDANGAGLTGGALSVYQGATTTISQSQFEDNGVDTQSATDPKGGAVYFSDTSWGHTLTVDNSTFLSNSLKCVLCSWPIGGGLFARTYGPGAVVLNRDSFVNNDGWLGAGVAADRATIDRTTFQGNTGGSGGGAYLTGASEIEDSAFLQNSVVNAGGGLYVGLSATSLSMEDTKFIGNAGGYDLGGAMFVDAQTITMKNVAVADTLVTSGSAMEFSNPSSTIELIHVTVNDTHLQGGARTGTFGIHIKGPDIVNIWNSMITNHGTGVQIDAGSACLLDHTLWFGNAYNIAGPGESYDISPISSDPAYAVDRYHLTSASGAIDSGVDRLVYHDIDDDARDTLPDVGADEFRVRDYLPCIMR